MSQASGYRPAVGVRAVLAAHTAPRPRSPARGRAVVGPTWLRPPALARRHVPDL